MGDERDEHDEHDERDDPTFRGMESLHRRFSDLRKEVQGEARAVRETLSSHNTRIALVESAQERQKEKADIEHNELRRQVASLSETIKEVREEVRSMVGGVNASVTMLLNKFDGHVEQENKGRKAAILVLLGLILSILGFLGVQAFLKIWGGA